jgi:hypothetical protein
MGVQEEEEERQEVGLGGGREVPRSKGQTPAFLSDGNSLE